MLTTAAVIAKVVNTTKVFILGFVKAAAIVDNQLQNASCKLYLKFVFLMFKSTK